MLAPRLSGMLVKLTFDAARHRLYHVNLRLKIRDPHIFLAIRNLVLIDWNTFISKHYIVLNSTTSLQILHYCILFHSPLSYLGTLASAWALPQLKFLLYFKVASHTAYPFSRALQLDPRGLGTEDRQRHVDGDYDVTEE